MISFLSPLRSNVLSAFELCGFRECQETRAMFPHLGCGDDRQVCLANTKRYLTEHSALITSMFDTARK